MPTKNRSIEPAVISGAQRAADYCGLVHRATVWKLIKAAEFPRPIQLGPQRRGWLRAELDAWLAERERC